MDKNVIERVKKCIDEFGSERLPMLTLSEFFSGNSDEESLAPNQWGDGRPPLAEIWACMREVEARPDVAWVGVVLHPDTNISEAVCEIAADTIAICTTAKPKDLESMIDCERLCADGVIVDKVSPKYVLGIPDIPKGYKVLQVVWD
ncbi:MAG: hypothetical protein FWH20_07905 [Oscillospiraceae bacterium]|nr:hypothetical protein [Oscillospiraceae bacterium]